MPQSIIQPQSLNQLIGTPTKRQVSKRQVSKRLVSKRPFSKRPVYKTSGLKNVRFKNVQFLNFIYLFNKKYRKCQVCIPIQSNECVILLIMVIYGKKPSKIENKTQLSLCLQSWPQQNLRISTNHKYRIYMDAFFGTGRFEDLRFCKSCIL
jgi:hypothetical protein